jgi:hypothetical protein
VRAERSALQAAVVDAAVGDEAVFGLGIFLVEKMVAEREEDWFALNTCGSLDNMGMMPDDQVRSVLDQPARLLLLGVGRPILQFVAPMNGYNNQVRQLAGQPQLLRQLDRGDLLHAAIGSPDGCDRDETDRELAEAKELRGAVKVERQQAALLACCACFASTRLAQVAGVVVFRGHQAETRLLHQLGCGVRRGKAKLVLRGTFCRITKSAFKVAADETGAAEEVRKAGPRACLALVDFQPDKTRHHHVAGKEQAKIAGGRLCRGGRHDEKCCGCEC